MLQVKRVISHSANCTVNLGRKIAVFLNPGDVVCLSGDLGSGKTVLAKGICQGLGVKEEVTSSSFVIVSEYQGRLPVCHIDLYRLTRKDLAQLPVEEYILGNGVTIIEWADRMDKIACVRIKLAVRGKNIREIEIEDLRN